MTRPAYRAATTLTLITAFLLVFFSLGVGIIGADGEPANLMYAAVILTGLTGAAWSRLHAPGLARTATAMAAAQALITLIALITGVGADASPPLELILLNGIFIALFLGAAGLYRRASTPARPR